MPKYWIKLSTTAYCILKKCFDEMFDSCNKKIKNKLTWGCTIKDILGKYVLNYLWFIKMQIKLIFV